MNNSAVGTAPTDSNKYIAGESVTVAAAPATPAGYESFSGWKRGGSNAGDSFAMPAENVTLTGTFTPITYTIGYTLNDGTVTGTNPTSYNVESATITLNNPTRTGYTFKGWSGTDLTGDENTSVIISTGSIGDRTYTANFALDSYTISYDLDGGTVSGTNPASYTIESALITLINPTREGYRFMGWSGTGLTGETNTTVTIPTGSTGNRSYTATWAPEYTVT